MLVLINVLSSDIALDYLSDATFGQGTGPIVLDDIGCMGTEETLFDFHTVDCTLTTVYTAKMLQSSV